MQIIYFFSTNRVLFKKLYIYFLVQIELNYYWSFLFELFT